VQSLAHFGKGLVPVWARDGSVHLDLRKALTYGWWLLALYLGSTLIDEVTAAGAGRLWEILRHWPARPPKAEESETFALVSDVVLACTAVASLMMGALALRRTPRPADSQSIIAALLALLAIALMSLPVHLLQGYAAQGVAVNDIARRAYRDAMTLIGPCALLVAMPLFLSRDLKSRDRIAFVLLVLVVYVAADLGYIGNRPRRATNELIAFAFTLVSMAVLTRVCLKALERAQQDTERARRARSDAEDARRQAEQAAHDALEAHRQADEARAEAAMALTHAESVAEQLRQEKQRYLEQTDAAVAQLQYLDERFKSIEARRAEFVGSAVHDLMPQVAAVRMWVQHALHAQDRDDAGNVAEALQRLDDSAHTLHGALRSVLEYAEIDSGRLVPKLKPYRLRDCFVSLDNTFRPAAKRQGLQLHIEMPPASCLVLTDMQMLIKALSNLVSNAIKYTPKLHGDPSGPDIVVRTRTSGLRVLVDVSDKGVGIPKELHRQIFMPGYRVEGGTMGEKGYGLGLASVARVLNALGGGHSIELNSEMGRGSTFTVGVPQALVDEDAAVDFHTDRSRTPGTSRPLLGALIALVDDDEAFRHVVSVALENAGAYLLQASDVSGIVQAVRNNDRRPDIIVTDFHLLGEESGLHVIDAVRSVSGSELMPAVVLTADPRAAEEFVQDLKSTTVFSKERAVALVQHLAQHYTVAASPLDDFSSAANSGRDLIGS